jgi:hypothetical protein
MALALAGKRAPNDRRQFKSIQAKLYRKPFAWNQLHENSKPLTGQ